MRFEAKASFVKSVKKLEKKYKHLRGDLKPVLKQLEENPRLGVAIPGFGELVWKVRLKSSDMKRGKSGGFRLIYAVREKEQLIVLLFLYPKSTREDMQATEIKKLLE